MDELLRMPDILFSSSFTNCNLNMRSVTSSRIAKFMHSNMPNASLFVFNLRVYLRIAPETDAGPQVIHCIEVILPLGVYLFQ